MFPKQPPVGLSKNLEWQWLLLQERIAKAVAGAGGGGIVYRPGAPSSGNCVGTWAEVMAVVSQSERATVFVDTSKQSPIGSPAIIPPGTHNMRLAQIKSVAYPTGLVVLEMQDGAVLDNLGSIADGLELRCFPSTAPCFTFSLFPGGVPWVFAVWGGALIDNQGSVPAIEVPNGQFVVVANSWSGWIGPQGGPFTTPLVHAAAGGMLIVASQFGQWADNWLSGDVGSQLSYAGVTADFPDPSPNNPLFLGTSNPVVLIEHSGRVGYTPADAADWNNDPPDTVQAALDRIAAQLGPIT